MSVHLARSPRILELAWGRLRVEGQPRPLKDAKLFPGGARAWDWSETGTRHHPGIQPTDLRELLDRGAAIVVLSTGQLRRLRVSPAALEELRRRDTPCHVLPTAEAVALYNRLRENAAVGALIHTTC